MEFDVNIIFVFNFEHVYFRSVGLRNAESSQTINFDYCSQY